MTVLFCKRLPVLSMLALLAACEGPQNMMEAAGPAARGLAALGWFVMLTFIIVTVVVWLLIMWVAQRRRGTLEEHEPIEAGGGQRWILIGGFTIPVAILAIVFIASLQSLGEYPLSPGKAVPPDLKVVARQWWFTAEYPRSDGHGVIRSPTEIHIPAGQPVDIELETRDVIHSFWVPKLHGKVDMVPGMTNRIRLRADEPGTYYGQCGEFCGAQHAHMRLLVIAHPPDQFQSWLKDQAAPAREPTGKAARRGKEVFMNASCAICHTIRGTPARGNVGPDLTHVASRERIAGGAFPNNTANLSAWVTHAQSLKPGSRMPDVTAFTGEELQALVAYLQSLE